ncbi:MAG: tetratricopeptide repeat protein, partial [Pedosphaera parvula]|nr:tetratricopeptide repeat protein [Pedosphaera parvula]
ARAAAQLVELGGQQQLVRALLSDSEEVRSLASDALWEVWIRSEGEEVYHSLLAADEAAGSKRYDEALRILDEVVAHHPDFAEGWNRRAIVNWQTRRYSQSMQDCQRAVALNPCHFGAWNGLAFCQVQLGNLLGARWSLEAVLHITPHDDRARKFLRACDVLLRRLQPKANAMMEQA